MAVEESKTKELFVKALEKIARDVRSGAIKMKCVSVDIDAQEKEMVHTVTLTFTKPY